MSLKKGLPNPLGATLTDGGVNFALFSRDAKGVTLLLIDPATLKVVKELPVTNRTGDIWHLLVEGLKLPVLYAYRMQPNAKYLLSDPYAKALSTPHEWGSAYQNPYGVVMPPGKFDWEGVEKPRRPLKELIIYEMHVRGFTQDKSSGAKHPGTFLGVIEKIPYLLELGVNAVELLPVHEFNENEIHRRNPVTKERLYNFWGYSTVNFFAPMNRYAVDNALLEFKTMVKELHRNGIEVILDVVFNHTAEKKKLGVVYSFMGIDRPVYYLLDEKGEDQNFTGCGNTMNLNHPVMSILVRDCLNYWAHEMQVDGFRFDLASIMNRDRAGKPVENAPLVEWLTFDPGLAEVKLIAEPWDAVGMYQLGGFEPQEKRWSEWNGKYRDAVRSFIKGDPHSKNEFATRICGSNDLFSSRSPQASINFITAHDGFSLCDLVSYNQKHNKENGEGNKDGNNYNISWNCGAEGEARDPAIQRLRLRQMKNFMLALFISQGVPMILMGDEYGHTRRGNNNPYCQDNALNWFLWQQKSELFDFVKRLIQFRKQNPLLMQENFLGGTEVIWHGVLPLQANWDDPQSFLALSLRDQIYIAFNATNQMCEVTVPPPVKGKKWQIAFHTHEEEVKLGEKIALPEFTSIVLVTA